MSFTPFFFFAYIGPRPVATSDPTLYGHWDWYMDIIHSGSYPPVKYIGRDTLSASMTPASLSFGLTSSVNYPASAGMWIGPSASGEGWEYMAYYNSGLAAMREIQAGSNGYHTAGAPAYFWYPLEMNMGNLEVDFEQSENLSTRLWTAKLAGVRAPAQILKPEHMILITRPSVTPYNEANAVPYLLGFVERVQMQNDQDPHGTWEIEIVCTSRLLQNSQVPAMRLGPLDIALSAEVDASSSLGATWKVVLPQMQQVRAGTLPEVDLVVHQEDMGPKNIVDGSKDTLWISDGWLGDYTIHGNTGSQAPWASIFAYPPPSAFWGNKYIEIINADFVEGVSLYVFSKWSIVNPDNSITWKSLWYQVSESNVFEDNGIDNDTMDRPEDRILIVENEAVFNAQFPAAKAKVLIDASIQSGADLELVRRLWWEGGGIFMHHPNPAAIEPGGGGWLVLWGNTNFAEAEAVWDANRPLGASFGLPHLDATVDNVNVLPGQVFRVNLTQSGPMQWVHDYLHHPGYVIDTDINGELNSNPSYRSEWVKVILPAMRLFLRDDIDPATMSNPLYIIDGQGQPNVEGLSNTAGGSIMVDEEIITFTGKDFVNGVLSGCTFSQKHKAQAKVYVLWNVLAFGRGSASYPSDRDVPLEGKTLQIATDAYPISRLQWGRGYYENGLDRTPFLGDYVVRFSIDPEAPDPTNDSYDNAYFLTIDSNSFTPPINLNNVSVLTTTSPFQVAGQGFRPRTILIQGRRMWQSQGVAVVERPRLNYFEAHVDSTYFNPQTWVNISTGLGASNDGQMMLILQQAGLWDSIYYFMGGSISMAARKRGVTDRDTALKVVSDLANYGSCLLDFRIDGSVYVGTNAFLLQTPVQHTPTRNYTDVDITTLEVVNVRPNEVGQVRLTWENGQDGSTGVVTYPDVLRYGGTIVDVGPLLADDDAMALNIARNLYSIQRFAYNVFVELSTTNLNIAIGEIHTLTYDFNHDGLQSKKTLMVDTVNQSVSGGVCRTRIGYREIDRGTL